MRGTPITPIAVAFVAAVTFAIAAAAPAAHAATYDIDRAHSEVNFKVKHMTISTVTGRFDDFDGTFDFDPATSTLKAARVTIRSASITTDNDRRDNHLRSDDFLNAVKYPQITFESTGVTPGKDGHFQVTGNLTIRDVTKPVVLDVDFGGAVHDAMMGDRAAFTATTTINRLDYGVKWNKTLDSGGLMVSNDVQIQIGVEGKQETGGASTTGK